MQSDMSTSIFKFHAAQKNSFLKIYFFLITLSAPTPLLVDRPCLPSNGYFEMIFDLWNKFSSFDFVFWSPSQKLLGTRPCKVGVDFGPGTRAEFLFLLQQWDSNKTLNFVICNQLPFGNSGHALGTSV